MNSLVRMPTLKKLQSFIGHPVSGMRRGRRGRGSGNELNALTPPLPSPKSSPFRSRFISSSLLLLLLLLLLPSTANGEKEGRKAFETKAFVKLSQGVAGAGGGGGGGEMIATLMGVTGSRRSWIFFCLKTAVTLQCFNFFFWPEYK